jgi:predicted nucleic acid-binding protein
MAREVVRNHGLWVGTAITPATVVRASEISEAWKLAFWDSMIFAAAEQDRAEELLSQDWTHDQVVAGVRVVNPFL